MYRLKQAAILTFQLIKKRLEPAGYLPFKESNGLWKHKTCKKIFALCVDDLGVKYFNKEDTIHLINILNKHYDISID